MLTTNANAAPFDTDSLEEEVPKKRGIQPGGPNPGGFRRGDDPRRPGGMRLYDGKTLAQMARRLSPDILKWWDGVWRDEKAPFLQRVKVSELIMERGHGKAVANIDLNVSARPAVELSMEELMQIAALATVSSTVEGECEDVTK